jgi:hypothetical protein
MVGGQPISMPYAQAPAPTYIPPRLESPRAPAPLLARGQKDSTPPAVRIPTPEELGVATSKVVSSEEVDWSMVERRIKAIGATGYSVDKTADGFRFICQLPTGPVSGRGTTKADAVRSVLAQLPR